jgi:CheY-like chemotaxis protein
MLVIEDDRVLTHVIRQILEARGHEVLSADDGSRGVATAQRRSPDAIVLDLMMPLMDGFAVLEAPRRDGRTTDVPVTVLSAIQPEGVRRGAMLPTGRQAVLPQNLPSSGPPAL